jgi:hypothetical protein
MRLQVLRFSSQEDSTSGLLFDITNGIEFLCYTLEDEYREDKIMKETRVPSGTYDILLRHKGMLCIHNAPDWKIVTPDMSFQYVLIHVGNTDEHTAGCLIIGDTQENNVIVKDGFIGKSVQAYKRVYPHIVQALEDGEKVTITYTDLDG